MVLGRSDPSDHDEDDHWGLESNDNDGPSFGPITDETKTEEVFLAPVMMECVLNSTGYWSVILDSYSEMPAHSGLTIRRVHQNGAYQTGSFVCLTDYMSDSCISGS